MLGKNKKASAPSSISSSTPSSANNSLVAGTTVEGTIHTENDIRIDGRLTGTLTSKGKVIIGPTGHIDGEVTCAQAVIEGAFTGKLVVTELLNVRETATINGDIKTEKLLVQAGAMFNVSCSMGGQKLKSLSDSSKAS